MGYHLITNRIPRIARCFYELPESVRAEFDYVDPDDQSSRFVQYRGAWYDVRDTQYIEASGVREQPIGWGYRVHPGEPLAWFDSTIGDSYFSGIAFRFVGDDCVIVGRYYS